MLNHSNIDLHCTRDPFSPKYYIYFDHSNLQILTEFRYMIKKHSHTHIYYITMRNDK